LDSGSIGIKRHCDVQFIDSKYLKPVEGVMSKLENEVRILVEEVLESWIPENIDFYDNHTKELIGDFFHELEDRMKAYTESCIRVIIGEGNEPEDDIYDSRDSWQCLYKIAPVGYSLETRQSYCVVDVGDILWLNGEEVKVTSLSPPHKPSSTGKVGCVLSDGSGSYEKKSREYFASVFDCQYVYSPIKLPVEG